MKVGVAWPSEGHTLARKIVDLINHDAAMVS